MRSLAKHLSIAFALAFNCTSAAQESNPQARGRPAQDLRCLSSERLACGCSLKIVTLGCPASHSSGWKAHFFSELHDGAPLWVNFAGGEFPLRSKAPVDNSFRHGRGDSWQDTYESENLKVRVRYRPAKSTCPPEKGEDGCEYFDVAADIVVTVAGAGSRTYRGLGSCGC